MLPVVLSIIFTAFSMFNSDALFVDYHNGQSLLIVRNEMRDKITTHNPRAKINFFDFYLGQGFSISLSGKINDIQILRGYYIRNLFLASDINVEFPDINNLIIQCLEIKGKGYSEINSLPLSLYLDTVIIDNTSIKDISLLSKLNASAIFISNTPVVNIPMFNDRLERLGLGGTNVSDLSPLKSFSLKSLSLRNTSVYDVSPLNDCPFFALDLSNTAVKDISMLNVSELNTIRIQNSKISDISVLLKAKQLQYFEASVDQIADMSPLEHINFEHRTIKDGIITLSFPGVTPTF